MTPYERVSKLARQLPAHDKARLIRELAAEIEYDLSAKVKQSPVKTKGGLSLFGVFSQLGSAPSLDDFRENRREMWGEEGNTE